MIRYPEATQVRKVTQKAGKRASIGMERFSTDGPRLLVVLAVVISLSILGVLGGTYAIMAMHYDTYTNTDEDVWRLILVPLLYSLECLLGIVLPLTAKAVPWRLVGAAAMLVGSIYAAQLLEADKSCLAFVIVLTQMLCTSVLGFILRGLGFQLRTGVYNEPLKFNRLMLALVSAIRIIDVPAIRARYKFLIRTLFSWTIALAALMSLLSVFFILVPKPVWAGCLMHEYSLFVAMPLVCVWIALGGLGEGSQSFPTTFLFIVSASIVMSIIVIIFHDISLPKDLCVTAVKDIAIGALLIVWLVVVRLVGFRLCREGWAWEE